MFRRSFVLQALVALLFSRVQAHIASWNPGMYCKNGPQTADNENAQIPIGPLFELTKSDWWFQHDRLCDQYPPTAGEYLQIPSGGTFTTELAQNRAFTTLSYDGSEVSDWPDGQQHPDDWNGWDNGGQPAVCLEGDGALHTWNESYAAGTAWAIAYVSDLADVTDENLVVFSTLAHTPFKRLATYEVPDLPNCDECICAWLWVPNKCGQANMYMTGHKCQVTGSTTNNALAAAQPPVYCADDPSTCVTGAKQMIMWQQADGNNIVVPVGASPGYNSGCGWSDGAQTDIFVDGGSTSAQATVHVSATIPSTTSEIGTPSSISAMVADMAPKIAAANLPSTTSEPSTPSSLSAMTALMAPEVPSAPPKCRNSAPAAVLAANAQRKRSSRQGHSRMRRFLQRKFGHEIGRI